MSKVKLSDIATVTAGNVAPKAKDFTPDGVPFVRAGSLSGLLETGDFSQLETINSATASRLRLKLFPAGTVVFAKSGMSCLKGYVYTLPRECYVVSHLACVTPNEGYSQYLQHYFRYWKPNRLIENPSFPSIKLSKISDIKLSLPDSVRATEIVANLEAVLEAIDAERLQVKKLDELVKSRFVEMFGLEEYPIARLSQCVASIDSGKSPKCNSIPRTGNNPAVLKLSAVSSGVYLESENKELLPGEAVAKGKEVVAGDILLARKNTPELVGKSVYVSSTEGNIMFPDIVFRMHPLPMVDGIYLSHLLSGPLFDSIRALAHGSAKSMSNIPKTELAQLPIPMPPLALQQEFAAFVQQVDKLEFETQQAIDKLQMLYDSLAQEYFAIE